MVIMGNQPLGKHGLDLRDLYRTETNTTNVSFSKSVKDFNTCVFSPIAIVLVCAAHLDAIRRFLGFKTNFKPTPWMNVSLIIIYLSSGS